MNRWIVSVGAAWALAVVTAGQESRNVYPGMLDREVIEILDETRKGWR